MLTWLKKRNWRSHTFTLIAFLIVAGGISLYQQRDLPSQFALPLQSHAIDGQHIDLQNRVKDKTVLLYFWGEWCAICDITSPAIQKIHERFNPEKYEVITVALKSGTAERVQDYLQSEDYSFTTINDPNGVISQQWGVHVTPSMVYIEPGGEISTLSSGLSTYWGMALKLWWAGL